MEGGKREAGEGGGGGGGLETVTTGNGSNTQLINPGCVMVKEGKAARAQCTQTCQVSGIVFSEFFSFWGTRLARVLTCVVLLLNVVFRLLFFCLRKLLNNVHVCTVLGPL